MYRELNMKTDSRAALAAAILSLSNLDEAVMVRHDPMAPLSLEDWVEFLVQEVGLAHDTRHYDFGENLSTSDWWEISNQPDKASSYAYSNTPQPFHSDNAWFADGAEINFFLMARQARRGGDQLIYPVSRLISDLDRTDRSLLHDLLSTRVVIKKGDADFQHETPIVVAEEGGRVYWNFYRTVKTDPFVSELCDRFFAFLKTQETSNSVYSVHCETGDSLVFNDQKVLHARTAFEASMPRDRVLYQSMWRLPPNVSQS